jgi:hypothetical protein
LKKDVTLSRYAGYWKNNEPVMEERTVKAGTTVKITMASRFGDLGITDDLKEEFKYGRRGVSLEDLDNLRLEL